MVIDGRLVLSDEDIQRQQGAALLECRKAKQALAHLLATADQMSKRSQRVAKLLQSLQGSNDFMSGPAVDLLQLPDMEYGEAQSLATVKALANSVILAQRQIAEATQRARDLGVTE